VSGIVSFGQVVPVTEAPADLLEVSAYVVGAAVKTRDDIDLALHPASVVRCCSGECGEEELLVRLAEPANINDDAVAAREREVTQQAAEAPPVVVVESGKLKFGFLAFDEFDVLGEGHARRIVQDLREITYRISSAGNLTKNLFDICDRGIELLPGASFCDFFAWAARLLAARWRTLDISVKSL
jgi:hypothetical protein